MVLGLRGASPAKLRQFDTFNITATACFVRGRYLSHLSCLSYPPYESDRHEIKKSKASQQPDHHPQFSLLAVLPLSSERDSDQ